MRGGGNRYLIDSVNGVCRHFDKVVIASNCGGLFKEDLVRLNCEISVCERKIVSRDYSFKFLEILPVFFRTIIIKALKPLDPLLFLINFLNFVFLVRKLNPSAILSCNGGYPAAFSTIAMVLVARMTGTPCAFTIVSLPTRRSILLYPYEWLIDQLVWRSAKKVIVNAHAIKQAIAQIRGCPGEKITVVHNGLEEVSDLNRKKVVGKNDLIIGCVARMARAKGVLFLLEAFVALASKYQNIHLVLVGEGDVSGELSRRINELGLQDRVRLTGYYNGDIHGLLMSLDIYVFPSLWEGFPYSILEAMRAGCPIVTTNVGGIPEAIDNNEEGLLVTPGSCKELEIAIEKLALDEGLRVRLGNNARKKFDRSFSLSVMNKNMNEALTHMGLLG